MFNRFTERTNRMFAEARRVALDSGCDWIDTHILLLAFLSVDAWCVRTLLGDEPTAMRFQADLQGALKRRKARSVEGQLPFTPDSKRTLETAMEVAAQMGHGWVVPEHVLVGAMTNLPRAAADVCTRHGVSEERVRKMLQDHQLPQ